MVADGAIKLDYTSVIFVDPEVQIDETKLDSLTTVAVAIRKVVHYYLSKTMAKHTPNMPVFNIRVL